MSLRDDARTAAAERAAATLPAIHEGTLDDHPDDPDQLMSRGRSLVQAALTREAEASTRLDGDTVSIDGPVTVGPPPPDVASEVAFTVPPLGTLGPLRLTAEQYEALLRPIAGNRVQQLRNNSHLEAWDVRRHLNRFFGFGGWDLETIELVCVREIEIPPTNPNGKPRWTVVYRCQARLTIKNPDGSAGAVYEDGAAGDSQNQPSLGDAHDQAMKTALSQALKRCVVNLGDQFGLSLYNDGSTAATVVRTLAGPPAAVTAQVDQVTSSEQVRGEPDPEQPDSTGLPTALQLRDEALDPDTSIDRLRVIMADIHPKTGPHPATGIADVVNENGEDEKLAALVYRQIKDRWADGNAPADN